MAPNTAVRSEGTPFYAKLLTAGAAGCIADFATFPFDTAKVRLQVQGENVAPRAKPVHTPYRVSVISAGLAPPKTVQVTPRGPGPRYRGTVGTIMTIAREEGPKSLYNGLTAGLQRQAAFASIRIGCYDTIKTLYQSSFQGDASSSDGASIPIRVCAGMSTGALAVLVAQPTEVVKVRFQAAARSGGAKYSSTLGAYKCIAKNEGFQGLWRGTFPNVARNSIVSVAEIVCYDVFKDLIIRNRILDNGIPCHFSAAVMAGFSATVVASPVDVVKTRFMNSTGKYKNAIDCAVKTAVKEGPTAFYKGFMPAFSRLVSWNICMWITYEQIKKAVDQSYHS